MFHREAEVDRDRDRWKGVHIYTECRVYVCRIELGEDVYMFRPYYVCRTGPYAEKQKRKKKSREQHGYVWYRGQASVSSVSSRLSCWFCILCIWLRVEANRHKHTEGVSRVGRDETTRVKNTGSAKLFSFLLSAGCICQSGVCMRSLRLPKVEACIAIVS